jgi:peptidoglycan hydrolase-like protein with peptidoglycan-binding domain
MNRLPLFLVNIVFHTLILQSSFADEQVRQLQEELGKRHLFYGNPDGEFTPALSAAISAYQKKKGFPITGTLDPATRASLGLRELVPQIAPRPVVVVTPDDVRDGNGELLPGSTALFSASPNEMTEAPLRTIVEGIEPSPPAVKSSPEIQPPAEGRPKRIRPKNGPRQPHKSTNLVVAAYQSLDHAVKLVLYDTQPRTKRPPKKHG